MLKPLGNEWSGRIQRVRDALGDSTDGLQAPQVWPALCQFLDLVVTWNARTNLTAARSADELVDLFLADALVLARSTDPESSDAWVDVGSGAGAPGLPLALLRPRLALTLLEPRQKRAAFLRTAVGELGCSRVAVRRERSDVSCGGAFDVAMSRATLPPAEWLKEGSRLANRYVWLLLASAEPLQLGGWSIDRDENYNLPLTGMSRRAVRYVRG
jgi:16S rRNA (guanine527-N7)-methyltransferase